MFVLVIKSGPLAGRRVEPGDELSVGRAANDLTIDDPAISRHHAVFRLSGDGLEVEDLGSRNGTSVNGQRIASTTPLAAGDAVELGGTVIEIEAVPTVEEPAEEPEPDRSIAPTRIATAVPELAAPPASDVLADADELRPVTALFADVVGSTSIGERLTPEEVKALIGECVSRMTRAVEQFGGVVDAFMGDGIAAFFGIPVAHEDDPERAARAALHIVQVVGDYARDIEAAWGISDFNVRVGLNSGPVAVGLVGGARRQSVALGDTANVAARLQGVAEPGSIVAGDSTVRRLLDRFVFEPLDDVSVKGRAEPVSIWRLRRPMQGLEIAPTTTTPLVGRDDEIGRLTVARDDLLSGRGQVLLVLGDAGLGKTRMLSELRRLAGESVVWLEGNCVSYGAEFRLLPVVEALRDWLGLEEGAATLAVRTRLRIKLEPLLGDRVEGILPHLESLLSGLGDEPGTIPESRAEDVRRACCEWIEALAGTMPVALVFEDLQWADPWTCDLADDLLQVVERAPLLLAASFRISPQSDGWRFRVSVLADHPHRSFELALAPLSNDEAVRLLSMLAPTVLDDASRDEIVLRAEGNPLYLEQLLQTVLETGGLEQQRQWTLSPSATRVVPAALESLLLARIDNLSASARQVAQAAAIIGRSFLLSVLRRVCPADSLEDDVSALVRAGVIRERKRYPELEYTFTHVLLREAALSTLTRASRRELYGRVAAALEELYADSLEEHLELLAHYYGRSDDLAKALEYLERAADGAIRLDAGFQAAELWRRAARVANELGDADAEARIAARLAEGAGS